MEEKLQKTIDGLKETLFYLAFCCTQDSADAVKIQRMAESINDAMELLKGDQDGTMG